MKLNVTVKETLKKVLVPDSNITVYKKGCDSIGEERSYAKIEYDVADVSMLMILRYDKETETLRIDNCGDFEDEEVVMNKDDFKLFISYLTDYADMIYR